MGMRPDIEEGKYHQTVQRWRKRQLEQKGRLGRRAQIEWVGMHS